MKKENKIIFWLILTRLTDVLSTYIATPNLKLEMNPVVVYLNFGWFGLIFSGIVLLIIILLAYKFGLKNEQLFNIQTDSLKDYISLFLHGKRCGWIKMLYLIPKWKSSVVFFGLITPITLIWYGVFLTINNMFIYYLDFNEKLLKIYQSNYDLHITIILVLPFIFAAVASSHLFRNKYKMYSSQL